MDGMEALRARVSAGPFASRFEHALARPDVKTILIAGCGGGFDFVHSMLLLPQLKAAGKQVVFLSYSFGVVNNLKGDSPVVYSAPSPNGPHVKLVSAKTEAWAQYRPELSYVTFLDQLYPNEAPHTMYACYARDWTVGTLTGLYSHLIAKHSVDAVLLIDGGSDSLMRGDEKGLGDPIEDAVSVGAVANCALKAKFLVSIGFGSDRFNDVSDASSMRAVAELTALGGFTGCFSFNEVGFAAYQALVAHIYDNQTFRSVLTGLILSAGKGEFGFVLPANCEGRVTRLGQAYVWPLMAMAWTFDVDTVAQRSLIVSWIKDAPSVLACHRALEQGRKTVPIRDEENTPLHSDMVG